MVPITNHWRDIWTQAEGALHLTPATLVESKAVIGPSICGSRVDVAFRLSYSWRGFASILSMRGRGRDQMAEQFVPRVLIVDDDEAIAALVSEVLSDEGYSVEILKDAKTGAVQEAVGKIEPNCLLLDSGSGSAYGDSWDTAEWLASRTPPVPALMFTARTEAVAEVQSNSSVRSRAADFTGILQKPFDIDELLSLVSLAVARSRAMLEPIRS